MEKRGDIVFSNKVDSVAEYSMKIFFSPSLFVKYRRKKVYHHLLFKYLGFSIFNSNAIIFSLLRFFSWFFLSILHHHFLFAFGCFIWFVLSKQLLLFGYWFFFLELAIDYFNNVYSVWLGQTNYTMIMMIYTLIHN